MIEFIIKYWLEALFGLALAGLSLCYKHLQTKVKESTAVKEGVLAMLHDRLCQSCLYFIEKGEITLTEFNNIARMYKAYHKLGGNST
jgi:hypothetical protein